MARKKVARDLLPLPRGVRFKRGEDKSRQLLETLRSLASKNRRKRPRTFYSVRDVAKHFRLPVSTVAKVYREMENEGILGRVRSSRTILQGRAYDRRLKVRGFVSLPALSPQVFTMRDYRTFYVFMDMELRYRGFVPEITFLLPFQTQNNVLAASLNRVSIDTAVWLRPDRNVKGALQYLADMGIRILGVADRGNEAIPCRYQIRKDSAIQKLLLEWKSGNGVRRVTVVESREHRSPRTEEILHSLLAELSIASVTVNYSDQPVDVFLSRLQSAKTDGIIFPSGPLATMFCFRNSDGVMELLRRQRVAFIDGAVEMPFAKISPSATVDVVTVDWQLVAASIVEDLVTQKAFESGHRVFEANTWIKLPVSKFVEPVWDSGMRRFDAVKQSFGR